MILKFYINNIYKKFKIKFGQAIYFVYHIKHNNRGKNNEV